MVRDKRLGVCLGLALALAGGCDGAPEPGGYRPTAASEVWLDPMGIPHIYARTDEDALYASGYMMARLRLFQLDMVRRRGRGTTAEVLGGRGLRDDIAARTFHFAALGERDRERMQREHPDVVRLTDAFVSGINRYIDRVRGGDERLPVFFEALGYRPERFSAAEPYIIGKMLSFGMSSSLDSELLATLIGKLSPQLAKDVPLSMPTRPAFTMVGLGGANAAGRSERPGADLGRSERPGGAELGSLKLPGRSERPGADPGRSERPGTDPGRSERPGADPWTGLTLPPYERLVPEMGSNNWAVAGSATADGRPLLAGDPHQPLGNPLRFYVQHLNSMEHGGSLDAIGFSFTGTPGIQLGHNRALAWTATTNFADVMDLWDVARTSTTEGADAISLGGVARPVRSRTESILIRPDGGAVTDAAPRELVVGDVPGVGVLLPEELLPAPKAFFARGELLFAWTGFQPTSEAASYLGMTQARTLAEWDAAVGRLEVGAVNLVAADTRSIRYHVHAQVPDRGDPARRPLPYQVMDGADPRTVWTGAYLSDAQLPQAQDPPRGFLATANNEPWGFTAAGHPERAPFYYGYFYDPGDRAFRIQDRLGALVARGKVTAEDLVALQADTYSLLAEDIVPEVAAALSALGTDPKLQQYRNRPELFTLMGRLSTWDRQMRRDSADAVVFFALSHFAARRGLAEAMGPLFYSVLKAEPSYIFKLLRLGLQGKFPTGAYFKDGKAAVLVGALAETADWLTQRFGGLEATRYRWRDVHGAPFEHLLGGAWNPPVTAVDGSIGTVNVSSSTMYDGSGRLQERFTAAAGSIYRMVVGFDADGGPRARLDFPRGNDEDPASAHYDDQQAAWVEGKPAPLRFRRAEVEAAGATRSFLLPGGEMRTEE